MRYERVKITRDPHTSYTREMPTWEAPVVEFIFGPEAVSRTGIFVNVPREYPSAADEFDRLTRAYGKDTKSDIAHVASVYGQSHAGIKALQRAINEDRAESAAAEPAAQDEALLA